MFELKDSIGRQLFETISITLVCDDCMKTDNPELCTHKLAEMPRWLSSAKMEVVKSLLSEDPAMLLRESMGVGADSNNKAFHATDINNFISRPGMVIERDPLYYDDRNNTNHIVIAVDPAGGGASAFSICSMVQQPSGSVVVLGIDALRTKDVRQTHKAVLAHCEKARTIKNLENATLVFSFESNLAYEAQHIIHAIQAAGIRKWCALTEGAGNTLGWLTTNERKESMMFSLRDALAVGSIHLSSEFFSLTQGLIQIKQQVEDELRNYCVIVEPSKTPFGKVKKTYTGKVGGRNDDVAVVIQLAIAAVRIFYTSDRYRAFRPENKAAVIPR